MPVSKREQLVDTAMRLFCSDGFQRVGIDRIVAEAGVAKMTLYNHFKSKDDLVLAALRRRDELFRNNFSRQVEAAADTPAGRLAALFDVLHAWINGDDFSGCMFCNAAAEYRDASSPIRALAAEHKRLMLAYIRSLAEQAGAEHPEGLAEHLNLLLEGAISQALTAGDLDAARTAARAARVVLDTHPKQ